MTILRLRFVNNAPTTIDMHSTALFISRHSFYIITDHSRMIKSISLIDVAVTSVQHQDSKQNDSLDEQSASSSKLGASTFYHSYMRIAQVQDNKAAARLPPAIHSTPTARRVTD